MSTVPCRRVGYWWSDKKSRKLIAAELAEIFRTSGLELVKLDLDRPFEEQGPFDAIVHKMSDIMVRAKNGDLHSKHVCESFQVYADSHPNMVVIDPLPNIDKVLDRYSQYKIIGESEVCDEDDIFIPAFVELTTMNLSENLAKMRSAEVDFPVVCKPSQAHGSTRSHQMSIIFNKEGLKDITIPCVVQKFINHNAVLFKLFIIGNKYFIIERPSLKNFAAGDQKTIYFDSNEVSKPHTAHELTELDDNEPCTPILWPDKEKMDSIVQVLHECVGLNLLGIDVVIDNNSGHYAIIDMNVFPGYSEAENFYHMLTNLVLHKVKLKEANMVEGPFQPMFTDSPSIPAIKMTNGKQKFTFDTIDIFQCKNGSMPKALSCGSSRCCCCPKTDAKCIACNTASEFQALGIAKHSKCSNNEISSHAENGVQEDSGIETSDSCDEKKNDTSRQTAKLQHSKVSASDCSTAN